MYDPFDSQGQRMGSPRATGAPNAVAPGFPLPELMRGPAGTPQPMPAIQPRPETVRPPQFGEQGFQPPPQWADEWAQYNSPEFQSQYGTRRDIRRDARFERQGDPRVHPNAPNALGPITPPGPGNLPPNPQTNPALPLQPLPPQAAPQGIAAGEYYPPQGYPQYGKLWG